MTSTREAWEAAATAVLTPHLGHTAVIQGWHHTRITERHLQPEVTTMAFAGFTVHCQTCDVSLSQQWKLIRCP